MSKIISLNDINSIKRLDTGNMLGSLELLSKQVEQVWQTAKNLTIPVSYKNVKNVAVLGMGGSALGAHVIKSIFYKELKIPVEIINDYNLPNFVNQNTLVVGSSYSGNTEETVAAVLEAKKRKAKIAIISAGGELIKFAKKNKLPFLTFTTENNPCGSPRMGLGYSIIGQLILFSKIGILKLNDKHIKEIIKALVKYDKKFGVTTTNNLAKQLAKKIIDKSVLYVASEYLLGSAHVAANQMNENGKRFAGYFAIPELNHHLLEGMMNPTTNKNNLLFILLESALYDKRVMKRYEITKKVLDKNKIQHLDYVCQEKDRLSQMCEILVLGSYVSYYCALLRNINPTGIPFVDFFKAEMKK